MKWVAARQRAVRHAKKKLDCFGVIGNLGPSILAKRDSVASSEIPSVSTIFWKGIPSIAILGFFRQHFVC